MALRAPNLWLIGCKFCSHQDCNSFFDTYYVSKEISFQSVYVVSSLFSSCPVCLCSINHCIPRGKNIVGMPSMLVGESAYWLQVYQFLNTRLFVICVRWIIYLFLLQEAMLSIESAVFREVHTLVISNKEIIKITLWLMKILFWS